MARRQAGRKGIAVPDRKERTMNDSWNPADPNQAAAHLRAKAKPKRRGWLADLSLAGVLLVAAVALAVGCHPRRHCVCPTCVQATLSESSEQPTNVKSPDV